MARAPQGLPPSSPADPSPDPLTTPLPAATSAAPSLTVVSPDEAQFVRGPRAYRVRGLSRCLSAESLKVTLRVALAERLHVDTLDLYQARGRQAFDQWGQRSMGSESLIYRR